jgi:hypothetical protein
MSLAGVKKKRKKCFQIWFWRLLAFVTDFAIVLAINRMSGLLSKQCSKNRVCVCFSHFCSNYSSWSRSAVTASAKATVRKSLQLNFFHFQSPKPILSVRKDGFTFVEGRHFFLSIEKITSRTSISVKHFGRGENLDLYANLSLEPFPAHFEEDCRRHH